MLIFVAPSAVIGFSVNDSSVNIVELFAPFICSASKHFVAIPELLELLDDTDDELELELELELDRLLELELD